MARLIVVEGGVKRALSLVLDQVTVGQGPPAQVRLKDPAVQPAHCQIVKSANSFIVTPSQAPMLLNGQPIMHPEVLNHGDQIQIGDAVLTFDAQLPPPAPEPEPEPAPVAAAHAPPRRRRDERRERRSENSLAVLGWILLVVVVLGGLGYVLNMTSRGLSPEQKLAQAKSLIATKRVDDALALLRDIDRTAGQSYEEAQSILNSYMRKRESRQDRFAPPDPLTVFELTVLPYYETYLKEKDKDSLDRARVQYFLEWRAKPYIKRFPDAEKAATIKRMLDYYKDVAPPDRSFPETFHDVSIVVEGERELSHFGEAYRAVSDWLSLRGGGIEAGEAKKLADQCVVDAKHHLDREKEKAWRYVNEQYFETAKRILKEVADNSRGISSVVSDVDVELGRVDAAERNGGPP